MYRFSFFCRPKRDSPRISAALVWLLAARPSASRSSDRSSRSTRGLSSRLSGSSATRRARIARGGDRRRQVGDADAIARQRVGARDLVLELAHVARPAVRDQARERRRVERLRRGPSGGGRRAWRGSARPSAGCRRGDRAAAAARSARRSAGRRDPAGTSPPPPCGRDRGSWRSTMRTSTLRVRSLPTRRSSPCCRTRSSLPCMPGDISPTSSRNSVPPSATSNRPRVSRSAPVNAPRT